MENNKIVLISDTHNKHNKLVIPECDILIHAGDYSFQGTDSEIRNFYKWLNKQPAKHIVSIQGNHEKGWEADPENGKYIALNECPRVNLLEDNMTIINGINIYGSPWTPYFHNWAYNAGRTISEAAHYRKPLISDIWEKIPEDTDILVTHGPPYDILDELQYINGDSKGEFVGCVELRKRIEQVRPDLHVFGHIHCQYGEKHIDGTSYYNASNCSEIYSIDNPPIVVEYAK